MDRINEVCVLLGGVLDPASPGSASASHFRKTIRAMRVLILVFCTACMAGCASSQQARMSSSDSLASFSSTPSAIPSAAIESELRTLAESWKGTPHLEGGDSRSGIDAPGLVMVIADQVLGLSLPHSTARQLGFGEEIRRSALMPGDILFFRPTSMPRHVGVYLGSEQFLHAWPDGGVSIARLDEPYWNGAYWAGRRVLAQASPAPAAVSPEDPPDRPKKRRVGW